MNEAEWQTSGAVTDMLAELGENMSSRKLRLFAVACVRRVIHLVTDLRSRRALDVAERVADGLATEEERVAAENEARYASYDNSFFHVPALQAVVSTLSWDIRTGRPQPVAVPPQDPGEPPAEAGELEELMPDEEQVDGPGGFRGTLESLRQEATREAAYGAVPGEDEAALRRAAIAFEDAGWAAVLREIVGNPYRPVRIDPMWLYWNEQTIPNMARAIADARRWSELPILGDALEEAGCANRWLLDHLRGAGPHYHGCWALDLLLGRC